MNDWERYERQVQRVSGTVGFGARRAGLFLVSVGIK